ncbi:MAG: hypothetical protein KAT00_05430 [Planctomycetes bacterium]|nr:hypothetical protein [Planctomycetota bacterium]
MATCLRNSVVFTVFVGGVVCLGGCGGVEPIEAVGQLGQAAVHEVSHIGAFIFEFMSSRKAIITGVKLSGSPGRPQISGKVKRSVKWCCRKVVGHVDIAVFDADDYLVKAFSVNYSPYFVPKHGSKSSSFATPLPEGMSEGFKVRIAYHDGKHLDDDMAGWLDCGNNIALLAEGAGDAVEVSR